MNVKLTPIVFCLVVSSASAPTDAPAQTLSPTPARVLSKIDTTAAGERIMLQQFEVQAPLVEVWRAYTSDQGWQAWAAPRARIDLRVGGEILTHYGEDAQIGDPGTNRLRIVNYVPQRLLTLQADLAVNWPEVMKEDANNLYNVILFDEVDSNRTRVESYGVGYGTSPAYDELLDFFAEANVGLLQKLIAYLETRER